MGEKSNMNRGKELAKNTIIISIGTFLPKFASIITIPIISEFLTKVEYGTYDLITSLVSLLLPVVTLQIQSGVFRFIIDCRDDSVKRKQVITSAYLFLIPISILSIIGLDFYFGDSTGTQKIILGLYFLSEVFITCTRQIVRGFSKNKLYSFSTVVQSLINAALVVVLVGQLRMGLNGVLIANTAGALVSIIVMLFWGGVFREVKIRFFSSETLKLLLAYSWPMIPNVLSSWILRMSDRFVIKWFIGIEAVAVYAAAYKIPQLFLSFQGSFTYAWQENASLAIKDKDAKDYYSRVFDKVFCIIAGVMALLIGFSPLLFKILIKGDYGDSYPQISILLLGVFFASVSSLLGGLYIAHKKTRSVGITVVIAAVINLAIDLGTVGLIGLYAASISTLISYMWLTLYRMYDVRKFQDMDYNYKLLIPTVILLFAMGAAAWINILALNIVNAAVSVVLAFVLNRKIMKTMLDAFMRRVRKKDK